MVPNGSTPPQCTCGHCRRQRALELGLGPGPYTGAEFALIAALVPPSVDEVPPHARKIVARLDQAISAAEQAVDAALERYAAAELVWFETLRRAAAAGGVGVAMSTSWQQVTETPSERDAAEAAQAAAMAASEAREAAGEELARARVRYGSLVRQRTVARQTPGPDDGFLARLARRLGVEG